MSTKTLEQRIQILEDKDAITRLKGRYCNINDGGWDGIPTHHAVDELVDMFTPDGIWDGGPVIGARAEGSEEIRRLFTEFQRIEFVIHNVMNPIIDIDGDNARGDWHAIITSTAGSGKDRQALWMLGKYNEEYVRTSDGWKIKTLLFTSASCTPYELGWGKLQFVNRASVKGR